MHVDQINFRCKPFSELFANELYDAWALREAVFVVEQQCIYLDADGKDPQAWHLLGYDATGTLACYARLLPPGLAYRGFASIGRIVSALQWRGRGVGKALMHQALKHTSRLFSGYPIKISAQTYLLDFYRSFGFEPQGLPYLEDGIPHTAMVRPAVSVITEDLHSGK